MGISKKDLDQAYTDYKSTYGGKREDYFALLHIMREFEKSADQVARHIAFGEVPVDGIHAFHVDLNRRTLFLFQFAWDTQPSAFKAALTSLAADGVDRIFGEVPEQAGPLLSELRSRIFQDQAAIDKVLVHLVFNGDPREAEQGVLLDALREELESKNYLVKKAFGGREVPLTLHYISNEAYPPLPPPPPPPVHGYELGLESTVTATGASGERLHIGFVRIMDLYRIYREMESRLFERNIRVGLDADRPVNRKLRSAFAEIVDGKADPSVFAFNHNGVTLAAQELTVEDGIARVFEPRVLNGAQTITSLDRFLKDSQNRPDSQHAVERLGNVRVLARLVTGASHSFITTVTLNTNRQNSVDPANLRASDDRQLELQDRFRTELDGLMYERQEHLFATLTAAQKQQQGFDPTLNRAVEIKRLAKTFLAVQGEVDRISHINEVFDSETQYRACFSDRHLKADLKRVVLVYKVQFRLPKVMNLITESSRSYEFMPRAKNLLWALLLQGVLNHRHVAIWTESYGRTLRNESEFTDELVSLGLNKVRPILRQSLKDAKYQEPFDAEKFGFLRTKAFFGHCMETAEERYGWSKQAL